MKSFVSNHFCLWSVLQPVFFLSTFFTVFAAQGVTLDWSGYSRMDAHYQNKDTRSYGGYQLVLKPRLSILDGLNIAGRLELHPPNKKQLFHPSFAHRSFGLPLFYTEKGNFKDTLSFSPLFFDIAHIYINYETEFFQFQAGRSPRHFGLGVTYNEGSPFSYWLSTVNQLFFYTEYGPFYVQPAIITETNSFSGLLQGGILQDSWQVEAFYRYNTEASENYVEAFGEYKKEQWKARMSFSYMQKEQSALGLAFEGEAGLPWSLSPELQLKGGMASKGFSFHPGYDVGFLFQNYIGSPAKVTSTEASQLLIQEGALHDLIYLSSQLELEVSDSFNFSPLILLAWASSKNKMNYELDLQGQYTLEERFIISLKGGVLYSEKWNFGLLSQAVVTF